MLNWTYHIEGSPRSEPHPNYYMDKGQVRSRDISCPVSSLSSYYELRSITLTRAPRIRRRLFNHHGNPIPLCQHPTWWPDSYDTGRLTLR